MNALEKLALQHCVELAEKAANGVMRLSHLPKGEVLEPAKHIYPISSDCREIKQWIDAVLKNKSKP